jgi:golgin subfamily B member 1
MSEPGKPPDFSNLSENLTQQQVNNESEISNLYSIDLDPMFVMQAKITALKELVRQSETQHGRNTASAQEKVKNIAQRLSNIKSKSAKTRHQRSSSEVSDHEFSNIEEEELQTPETSLRTRSETPGTDKISMLRKQMELNRMKMAERESRSKEIEQMVTQLKSKFETSQMSLEKSVELGRSVGDLSTSGSLLYPQHRSSTVSDVSHAKGSLLNFDSERIKFLEKRIDQLENEKETFSESDKVQQLERKILDLKEKLKEKESIIEARTNAVSLLTTKT